MFHLSILSYIYLTLKIFMGIILTMNYGNAEIARQHQVFILFITQAFSGLNGSRSNTDGNLGFICNSGSTRLSRDIFTPNLHWLTHFSIRDCNIEQGLPSRLLENLKSLTHLRMIGMSNNIEGLVAHDTFAGLTSLQHIAINIPLANGRLPSGFFNRLKKLTFIDLTYANLDFIPPKWFNGLVRLRHIHLNNNNLHTLPPGLFDELRSPQEVFLHNNPWKCSCDILWLLNWSHITGQKFVIVYIYLFSL